MKTVTERFLRYVKIHTTSDDTSSTYPSTNTQLAFADQLLAECKEIGLINCKKDSFGYVTAALASNCELESPVIGFLAHMDTSPDAPGKNIIPILTENYNGQDIILKEIIISPKEFPSLNNYLGDTIITSNGSTLLGADDKAGIAEILTAMEYLMNHKEIKHGPIVIAFTPDEEIGRGVDHFDVKSFGAEYAYTIDGGCVGELEYENFNAARANITIKGKSVHPGTAKNIMINAGLVAAELIGLLPEEQTPVHTEKYEGFFHLVSMKATVGEAELSYIIRDFDKDSFEMRKKLLNSIIDQLNQKYGLLLSIKIKDEYYNMYSEIEKKKEIINLAVDALKECNIEPLIQPIRGGTDGARLSFIGLPCPNIFTGGHNFHGPFEFIPVSSMKKAVQVIVKISELAVATKK